MACVRQPGEVDMTGPRVQSTATPDVPGGATEASMVGVVVIGRNEGERLERCLRTVLGPGRVVVYVDSGSTDRSVAFAESVGATVVHLERSAAFTAARARNAGFEHIRRYAPSVKLVQFVDGDCELEQSWMGVAQRALEADAAVAVVCGHLRERSPDASVYNRLADLEWRRPVGEISYCGGIFMVRAEAFERVGGFNPAIAAGEEPDLCCRIRQSASRVVRVDHPMAAHDLEMTRFSQWWRRSVRGGYGALKLTLYGPPESRGVFRGQVRSALLWGFGVPVVSAGAALVGAAMGAGWWALTFLLLWPSAMMAQASRLAWRTKRQGHAPRDAAAHAVFTLLWKYAAVAGFVKCLADRCRERKAVTPFTREFHKSPV